MNLCWQKMLHGWHISKVYLRTKKMTWSHCAESVINTVIPTVDICWLAHLFKPSLSSYFFPCSRTYNGLLLGNHIKSKDCKIGDQLSVSVVSLPFFNKWGALDLGRSCGASKGRAGGTCLVVQWLRLCLPMQGVQVPSLVEELRFHMPQCQKTET